MNPDTEFRQPAYPQSEPLPSPEAESSVWRKIRRLGSKAVFWSYERGSWQYDIIVLVILAFIFLTPASWYHDRPKLQLTDIRHLQGIVQLNHKKNAWTFQVDARLVQSEGQTDVRSALEELLRPRVSGRFAITSVAPAEDRNGVVLGYDVVVTGK